MGKNQPPAKETAIADSLFDNRYRYNYIYPRGRSGETLRAVDTLDNDRPVVIKRPNPNDAPPIRAGQEVSIINERNALTRLAGHPVLTELLGSGQFFVGGIPQQYIVMERAEGLIVADEVARLAGRHQHLPELEALEIIDRLISLLRSAHDKDIVYNDVDAKHLFWHREKYELKLIDWGNAVFLEGDEVTLQGISRQTDIYQLGELLYFIFSGGRRVDAPRDASADFRVDFHQDSDAIAPRLQDIVSRALHPNLRYRYASLAEINADLLRYRRPLEQNRNSVVARALDKLKTPDLSQQELRALLAQVQGALRQNPAYPAARNAHTEIIDRLRDLQAAAALDAVKIYMRGENWAGAVDLLEDLRERTGSQTAGLVRLLRDWCRLLDESQLASAPPALAAATALLFEQRAGKAANRLILGEASDDEASRALQGRLAERVSAYFPAVLLLRPNLERLEREIAQLEAAGSPVDEARGSLAGIEGALAATQTMAEAGASALRALYRETVESLAALEANLQALGAQHDIDAARLPLPALTRALKAARALAENMEAIGKQAASNPRAALTAIDASRAIDPRNPLWEEIEDFLSLLYEILQNSQSYLPAADGSDLESWLQAKHAELMPFAKQLFDEKLDEMLAGLQRALAAWQRYREVIIAGNKAEATAALSSAAKAVRAISPSLAGWFEQLRGVVEKAPYVERHSVPGHLGRTLADGWAAFDQGQLADAQRLGQQAVEVARSESEVFSAERLWRASRTLRDWLERNGVESESRTQKALLDIEELLTDRETRIINNFAAQMPSTETYLKAMGQGLVQAFANSNSAALRILFCQYILCGVLDAQETATEGRRAIEDARFWQAAARRALGEYADSHSALRALSEYIDKRDNLLEAQSIFAELNGPHIVDRIGELARQLENSPQARLLMPGIQSLRAFESALQDWADAEFRPASNKIEQARRSITEAESNAGIDLADYRAWLEDLQAALAELNVKRRDLTQEIDRQLDEPQASIRDAIHLQADLTEDLLGYKTAQMMLGWRDTYEAFLNIYSGAKSRRQKLEAMDELFKHMFIDRNPAYALFRHWYAVVEALPEEPPPASAPEPVEEPPIEHALKPEPSAPAAAAEAEPGPPARRRPWLFNIAALLAMVLVLGGLLSLAANGSLENLLAALQPDSAAPSAEATATATPTPTTAPATAAPTENAPAAAAEESPAPVGEDEAEDAVEPLAGAAQEEVSAAPPTATATATTENTPAPSPMPTVALPPEGLRGKQDLLALYSQALAAPFWDEQQFWQEGAAWRFGRARATDAGTTIALAPAAEHLNGAYGNEAPRRIRRLEAELALHSASPTVAADEVYFGIYLQSADGGEQAGIQLQQLGPNAISLALYEDGQADSVSQRSVSNMIARLRLDRDAASGAISAYFNDARIGDPIALTPADEAILPVIFVKDGGLVISVLAWQITLE